MEAPPGIEPGYKDLQSSASPLRHGASVVKAHTYSARAGRPQRASRSPRDDHAIERRRSHCLPLGGRDISAATLYGGPGEE
jgi:hypothetical protein